MFFWLVLLNLSSVVAKPTSDKRSECTGEGCASTTGSLLQKTAASLREEQEVLAPLREEQEVLAPMLIEQDLSRLPREHYGRYDSSKGDNENIDDAFDKFLLTTGLGEELNEKERSIFSGHFKEYLPELLKHDNFAQSHDHNAWVNDVGKALEQQKPLVTQQLVDRVNGQNLGYTAELQEWAQQLSNQDWSQKMGKTPEPDGQPRSAGSTSRSAVQGLSVPSSFESAQAFPACAGVVGRIHNQGHCGSCWAFGSLSALDSRLCIKTNGAFSGEKAMLSRGQTTSCAKDSGCRGGLSRYTFDMYKGAGSFAGGVSGGDDGCSPYFGHGEGTEHFTSSNPAPPCPTQCTGTYTARRMQDDRFKFTDMSYREIFRRSSSMITLAKESMMTKGPLPFGIYAAGGFMTYRTGVYSGSCTAQANHEVTAVGWGTEQGVAYISSLNSWGSNWGINGAFKLTECAVTDFTIFDFTVGDTVPSPLIATGDTTIAPASPTPPPTYPPTQQPTMATPGPTRSTPAPTTAAPTTAATHGANAVWTPAAGDPCTVDAQGCVMSGNFPNKYSNSESCTFTVHKLAHLEVEDFSTESQFDYLYVNNDKFSGRAGTAGNSPTGIAVTALSWSSDTSVTQSGWKLCPRAEAPTSGPTPAPTTTTRTTTTPTTPAPTTAATNGATAVWTPAAGDPCTVDAQGCVMSANYPNKYGNGESCTFTVHTLANLEVEDFSTECRYDYLYVNNDKFSGRDGTAGNSLMGIAVTALSWSSDTSVAQSGWKLCPRAEAPTP